MRPALIVMLTLGVARAQTITEYPTAPEVKTITVGPVTINIFGQHPGGGQTQVAGYFGGYPNGTLIYNAVFTPGNNVGIACQLISPNYTAQWAFIPAQSPMVGYQLAAVKTTYAPPLFFGDWTPEPNGVARGGTF